MLFIIGRKFGAAVDWRVHSGRWQTLPLREFTNNQGQASADSTLALERRRLCTWRFNATRSTKNSFRWWGTATFESCWTRHDHGSIVRWSLLRRDRYRSRIKVSQRSWKGGFQQSTKLHCCYFSTIRSATTRRHWQEGEKCNSPANLLIQIKFSLKRSLYFNLNTFTNIIFVSFPIFTFSNFSI